MKKIVVYYFLFLIFFTLSSCQIKNPSSDNEKKESSLLVNGEDYICHTDLYDSKLWYMNNLDKMPLPDPHVYEENGIYYIVGTSGFYITCYSTTDFNTYKNEGIIYNPRLYNGWENSYQALFAPELYCFDGVYYLYYSAMDDNHVRRNSVVYSDNVLGPYIPIVNEEVDGLNNPLFLDKNINSPVLDSSVFLDDDEEIYMYYSVGNLGGQHVVGVKLINPYTADLGTYKELVKPGYLDSNFTSKPLEWEELREVDQIAEAPCMIKSNGKYYLTYSVNGCWNKYYNVCYAVSDSPLGNFVKPYEEGKTWTNLLMGYPGDKDSESLIYQQWNGFSSGTGHHCFFKIGNQMMIGYHAHKNRNWNSDSIGTERFFAIDYLYFDETGVPFCNGPTWSIEPLPSVISGYQNIVENAGLVYRNVEHAEYVNDNYIEKYYNLVEGYGKEVILGSGYSYIEFIFDKEYTIGGISIYNSSFYDQIINEVSFIEFDNGKILRNALFNSEKYVNDELQFIYPCSALTIEFKEVITSTKITIFFKTENGAHINEIQIFGK